MKKLLLLVVIVTLPIIAFFQFKNYRRFHPPVAYEYEISANIDVNYHDYSLVEDYYKNAVEIGAFARLQWRNEGIDVRFPSQDVTAELNAAARYNQLIARTQFIEKTLITSAQLKADGFSNDDIKHIEAGVPETFVKWMVNKSEIIQISFGDQSQYVWLVQRKLIEKGYDHALDGLFGTDTQDAITTFQQDNQLYPAGSLDEQTFVKLFLE